VSLDIKEIEVDHEERRKQKKCVTEITTPTTEKQLVSSGRLSKDPKHDSKHNSKPFPSMMKIESKHAPIKGSGGEVVNRMSDQEE